MTKTTIPKSIAKLIQREAELQAACDKWSVAAFRAQRDRLESVVHSGNATDADIEAHASSRDGGEVDLNYRSMEGSSNAALEAYRRSNWMEFREYLRTRLAARHQREAEIVVKLAELMATYGIEVDYSDPQRSITMQLAAICEGDSHGFIRFGSAVEIF